ncbi:MAG: RNA-directed DNA polymerase [Desulfobulbaceae bacterium]|nr:RNA-directed DNA polymerase [Desulfobulbaceae bacterium]
MHDSPNNSDSDVLTALDIPIEIVSEISNAATNSKSEMLLNFLKKGFPEVFSDSVGKTPNFLHKILLKPGTEPRRLKMRPIPLKRQEAVAAEIEKNIREGIMSPCPKSDWNSPLHIVNKSGGAVRLTHDFSQTLNPNITPSLHPLPRPEDIFRKVNKCKFFSKIDLSKAYWHIPLTEESKPLTAFLTESHGLLMMERLPMGMSDSGAAFQRCVEEKLQGLEGVYPYMDDILIGGTNFEQLKE